VQSPVLLAGLRAGPIYRPGPLAGSFGAFPLPRSSYSMSSSRTLELRRCTNA